MTVGIAVLGSGFVSEFYLNGLKDVPDHRVIWSADGWTLETTSGIVAIDRPPAPRPVRAARDVGADNESVLG